MSEFDSHIKENPKAKRDEAALREAFKLIEELRQAGFEAGEYSLMPSFGGNVPVIETRNSLANLRSIRRD